MNSVGLDGPQKELWKPDVSLLVGKRVKHKYEEGVFLDKVISVVTEFVNFYNTIYDNNVAANETTDCDYKRGNLGIIVQEVSFSRSLLLTFHRHSNFVVWSFLSIIRTVLCLVLTSIVN